MLVGEARIPVAVEERIPVAVLEDLLKQRIGWVDATVSPFAVAAREMLLMNVRQSFDWQANGRQSGMPGKRMVFDDETWRANATVT